MSQYRISSVSLSDFATLAQVDRLLNSEGIHRDKNLDHICAMLDEEYHVIATGSCYRNTLRCFAVRNDHQGEGLLNEIMTHLMELQVNRGNSHLFLYTKMNSAGFFRDLGFYEIARVDQAMVFMENRKHGFSDFRKRLSSSDTGKRSAAIVMNANPFSLGHQYLVECAAKECDTVHVFILSEDVSLVPFHVRKRLVEEGTAHLPNVICHESGPYIISNATFPSYFLKNEEDVVRTQARLDAEVFCKIASGLGITRRYLGEEPTSLVTGIYNTILRQELPGHGIDCIVVPRKTVGDQMISASVIRTAIRSGNRKLVKQMVPETTYRYLNSDEAKTVIAKIREEENLVH